MNSSDVIEQLVDTIISENPRQKSFLEESLKTIPSDEKNMLKEYIQNKLDEGRGIAELAESYNKIVNDTLGEQIYFRKNKKYRFSRFDEVADAVYFNDEYMNFYMLGLALTQFLWSNHRQLFEFFTEILPKERKGSYLEVGPGHGLHFTYAISHSKFEHFLAVDLSDTSIRLTKEAVSSLGTDKEVHVKKQNFLEMEVDQGFDFLVMGEVLEHVEEPLEFLKKLKSLSNPGAKVFITTCCNAPAVDHIYLFNTIGEVRSLCESAGFEVEREFYAPHPGTSLEDSEKRQLPINLAMVLK